ncbi:hypothetical protein CPter91_1415 [Collimonas pratensis]|uniref:Uncharacterized protein n=1 Tax=Collimonas pratensis TaxID=279113 RepID=A0A127Q1V2_9BURK|nr:hypothetical protein CPter91_1415 [Collimonas pratensis]
MIFFDLLLFMLRGQLTELNGVRVEFICIGLLRLVLRGPSIGVRVIYDDEAVVKKL